MISLSLGLLMVALVALTSAFALPQKKGAEKEPTLKEVVILEGKNRARLKSGFVFVRESENKMSVRRAGRRVTKPIGVVSCGVCPGGDCRATFIDPFTGNVISCSGCGGGGKDCTLNPF